MDHSSQEQTARREAAEPILAARRGMLAALAARPRMLRLAALGAIVLLAAALRFANLGALGYANHYYAAAVESMLQSWRNFFFVAAEPGGAVSVDKPPVGLWIQAASALLFGVNGVGLLLPGLLAGLASVALLYHLVRRWFGAGAGLLAALLLAITPVAVAVDRNNTIDSLLIFVLLLTAWAFVRAAETGRLRVLLLGAALAGVGFNIKMLQAFLPLPAFYALYLFGARLGWGRKLAHLGAATLVLGAVSLSWALAVDLTPAELRPYVGSSTDNTVLELIAGHNGLDRLVGFGGGAPGSAGQRPNQRPGQSFQRPGGGQQFPGGGQPPQGGAPGGGGLAGGFASSEIGQPGAARLFLTPLSKEASWFLPLSLLGAGLLAWRRPRWPLERRYQALALWGGWLLAGAGFFSVAEFYHEYYLAMIAPPAAALAAIGLAELWRLRADRPWLAAALLGGAAAWTGALQSAIVGAFLPAAWWRAPALALAAGGLALAGFAAWRRDLRAARVGWGAAAAGLLVMPALWAGLTALHPSDNQSLPSAYDGRTDGPANRGGLQVDQELIDYLQARTAGAQYLMAVPSSMQGSDYVIATGRPVLYLGGFLGSDPVLTAEQLAALVDSGRLRFIYWGGARGGQRGGAGGAGVVASFVQRQCQLIPGFEAQTQNAGAPGGTTRQAGAATRGGYQLALYDCGGAAP